MRVYVLALLMPILALLTGQPVSAEIVPLVILGHHSLGAKCLDVPNGQGRDGVVLQMWRCHGGREQVFEYDTDTGELKYGGLCVDAFVGGRKVSQNGDRVGLWTCHGGDNQLWGQGEGDEASGYNISHGAEGGLCLDIASSNASDGAGVIVWNCHAERNQRFWLLAP